MEHVLTSWKISQSHPAAPKGLGHPMEEVQFLELPGLTISHYLSWVNDMAKLASKANHRVGILCSKSFLEKSQLPTVDKAFVYSSMKYCFTQ